ncbi:MAG TPA: molybdenum ABC transporter ATP-binding protein [Candidatus Aquilonibacter sp.]|nr:molybdenum ABC transporter ATP-binding protein [Candidatus Aquilonibacter sp.]
MPTVPPFQPADSMLRARIQKSFAPPGRDFSLDVELTAGPGFTILFGASGAGKTTALNCIAGLSKPEAGRIAAGSRVLFDASARIDVPVAKRGVGYVFQELALFPHLTVEQNIGYGLVKLPRSVAQERSAALLHSFRIEHLAGQLPTEISGGERQRVALARALVTDPVVLLLDEPLAALDAPTKSRILDDLRAWNQQRQIPILYVTHSREEVFALGERVLVFDAGRIIAQGAPHDVLGVPRQETVAQLAGCENIFDAVVESIHADRGTMTCRLVSENGRNVTLETPLVRAELGSKLRVGIHAGDILLATAPPVGLSARNVIAGNLVALERRDVIVSAGVDCGVEMEVHLTLAARDSLQLAPGREVWLVIKTHSCHLMRE